MRKRSRLAALLFGGAMVLTAPIAASATALNSVDAEQVRKMEIMLMVSSLRCRSGENDFQAEYRTFTTRHVTSLRAAAQKLHSDLAQRHGGKGAKRALDKISVSMANRYGGGHPWLNCAELKVATHALSQTATRLELVATANYLLAPIKNENFQLASAR